MGNTKILKKLTLITLSILLMTAGFKIPANAFFNCKKAKCVKKHSKSLANKRIAIANPFGGFTNSTDEADDESKDPTEGGSSSDDETNTNDDNAELPGDTDNTGPGPSTGGTNPGTGGGNGDEDSSEDCAVNIAVLGIAKSFVACQIRTAITKGQRVLSLYSGLKRRMNNLLRAMKKAPVCTNNGYDLDEFENDHSIKNNIKAMRQTIRSMRKLLDALDDISLDCNNCDPAALEAALAAVDAIAAQLADLITDFKNQMTNLDERFSNFISRLRAVIALHSTDPLDIMQECNVSLRRAKALSRARLRVLRILDKLVDYKNDIDDKINAIRFGTHPCEMAVLGDFKAQIACVENLV